MYKIKLLNVFFFLILLSCWFRTSSAIKCETKCCESHPAVKSFQEFVQIDTIGEKNLWASVAFLARQAAGLGLPFSVYYPDKSPIWLGANCSLPSIALNTHEDVVPVEEKFWKHPPFSAYIDEDCNMYGRGTQDTKGVTIQYIEAIRKLMQSNVTLQRTLHITVMPGEESGGFHGIKPFVKTDYFRALNIGFALDEGLTSTDDYIQVSYQDKRAWQMKFTVFGEAGHGSGMLKCSAMDKMYKLLSIIMKFRAEQNEMKKHRDPNDFGAHTSVNINIIKGGYTPNVIPSEVSMVVDMRLAAHADIAATQAMVDSWKAEAGNDTLLEFIRRDEVSAPTPLQNNPFWDAMKRTAKDIGIKLRPLVMAATTDMLVLRNMGIPAFGFAPRVRTPYLLHANNEYVNVKIFWKASMSMSPCWKV